MKQSRTTQIIYHLVGCSFFLLLPIVFWPGEETLTDFFSDERALRGYTTNILVLGFFYFFYYYVIPRFYFKKKYIYLILIIVACYTLVAFLPEMIVSALGIDQGRFPHGPGHEPGTGPGQGNIKLMFRLGHNLIFFLAVIFFSLMLKINNRLRQAEKERLKAELSYFKAQINPHFLFNTLNSIYSLAIQKADNTPEAVVKLSGMMRYVISDADNDYVALEKEIGYITDYIELQKIRFGETVLIDFQSSELNTGKVIAPLILIPFIENAFKYGINPASKSSIGIRIELEGAELHMRVTNQKVAPTEPSNTGGLGILNARKRLSLLYPEKHRLVIQDGETDYIVDLHIIL